MKSKTRIVVKFNVLKFCEKSLFDLFPLIKRFGLLFCINYCHRARKTTVTPRMTILRQGYRFHYIICVVYS